MSKLNRVVYLRRKMDERLNHLVRRKGKHFVSSSRIPWHCLNFSKENEHELGFVLESLSPPLLSQSLFSYSVLQFI